MSAIEPAAAIEPIEITTMADFLALSVEQRKRCVPDMLAWAQFIDAVLADPEAAAGILATPVFRWRDDGRVGEIGEVTLRDKDGKVLSTFLPDFGATPANPIHICAFCGASPADDRILIAGPSSDICEECVELSREIIRDKRSGPRKG